MRIKTYRKFCLCLACMLGLISLTACMTEGAGDATETSVSETVTSLSASGAEESIPPSETTRSTETATGSPETESEHQTTTGSPETESEHQTTTENITEVATTEPEVETTTEPHTETWPETTEETMEYTSEIIPETETKTETETETETETDPVREPLELSVMVDPYIPEAPASMENVKAMWLSQFDLTSVYKSASGGGQRNERDFRAKIGTILQNVVDNGFNTVIVQVRPNADSMYPSEYYPPSTYVTGSYARNFTYDAFQVLIEEARDRGLSVHAWINPLRGVTSAEMKQISTDYPIRQWFDDEQLCGTYLVEYEGRWYLNPAYAEVRDLIVHGAREILQKYDVDGVHMDDYFYPTTDASFDSAAYAAHKAGSAPHLSLPKWRRENLSALVSELYKTVKKEKPDALFGISPAGILNTVYNSQYADVYRWCREPGFVDYILPQVYFGFEHATAPFAEVCDTWQGLIKTDYVTLLIGMSFGKAQARTDKWAGSGANEWAEHTDIMARCVLYTEGLEKCRGISIFCYQYFYHPVTGKSVAETQEERDNFVVAMEAAVWGTPGEDARPEGGKDGSV